MVLSLKSLSNPKAFGSRSNAKAFAFNSFASKK